MVIRLLRLLALGAVMLPFGGAVAFADDGPPRVLSAAGRLRPQQTIERIVNPGSRRALLALNGYGATPDQAPYWNPLFRGLPEFDHFVFGVDRCSYGTLGSLRANGAELRRCVRQLSRDDDYREVALAGVSMGGNTIFSANRQGLSKLDGASAEVSFDAPLNGSSTAALIQNTLSIADRFEARGELGSLVRRVSGTELDTPAMRDLAQRSSPIVPPGIRVLQFSAAGDEWVASQDSVVPGITIRTLTFPFLGTGVGAHGGQLQQPKARAQAVAVIGGQPVQRDLVEESVAMAVAPIVDDLRARALLIAAGGFLTIAITQRAARAFAERSRR